MNQSEMLTLSITISSFILLTLTSIVELMREDEDVRIEIFHLYLNN